VVFPAAKSYHKRPGTPEFGVRVRLSPGAPSDRSPGGADLDRVQAQSLLMRSRGAQNPDLETARADMSRPRHDQGEVAMRFDAPSLALPRPTSLGILARVVHPGLAVLGAAATLAGCGLAGPGSDFPNPARLDVMLAEATASGSSMPADAPGPIEWSFDRPQPDWGAVIPWNPENEPATVTPIADALRVTLTEGTRNLGGFPRGGLVVEVPELQIEDWGFIEVRARTSDPVQYIGPAFNLREGSGTAADQPYPFELGSPSAAVIADGEVHAYLLRADFPSSQEGWDGVLRELGLWIGSTEPASIDILSIRIVSKEGPFADAAVGVWSVTEEEPPALYIRAPGRVDFDVEVPDAGQLDVALGVVRNDAPVTFRVLVTSADGRTERLLDEVRADRTEWAARSVDLAAFAGESVVLTLEADSDREGTVALWRTPTLYTSAGLSVTIVDQENGDPTAVRARLTDESGAVAIGIMHGWNDVAGGFDDVYGRFFYVDGGFELELQPGTYHLQVSKGDEYVGQDLDLDLAPGVDRSETIRLERWVDMPERGWFSADDHIHLRRSPREDPLILKWIAAEDIHVGALLQMGDFWATYYAQYAWGEDGAYQVEDYMLSAGQEEPRTHEVGHTISLAADDFVRFAGQYYYYDRVFDRVHELGGVTGYAHKGISRLGPTGLTLDVLRDKVDFIEILQFGEMVLDHYYHYLDLGYKLTATAGSDFPFGGVIGDARFYTYLEDGLSFEAWRESLQAGHTFVSNGPMIDLRVNGAMPGDQLDLSAGSSLHVTAEALGHATQVPLSALEIVSHGEVIASVSPDQPGQSTEKLTAELDLDLDHGVWIAARARGGEGQVAHTTPVYVTTDGSSFHNPDTALDYLALSERYLDDLAAEIAQPNESLDRLAWRYREGLEDRIAETRDVIARLRAKWGGS